MATKKEQKNVEKIKDVQNSTYIVDTPLLNIRSGAGYDHDVVGTLSQDERITVSDEIEVSGEMWGKVDKGFVCLSFTKKI